MGPRSSFTMIYLHSRKVWARTFPRWWKLESGSTRWIGTTYAIVVVKIPEFFSILSNRRNDTTLCLHSAYSLTKHTDVYYLILIITSSITIYGQRNSGSERFSDLPKVMQPARSKAKWKTHVSDKGLVTARLRFMPLLSTVLRETRTGTRKSQSQE